MAGKSSKKSPLKRKKRLNAGLLKTVAGDILSDDIPKLKTKVKNKNKLDQLKLDQLTELADGELPPLPDEPPPAPGLFETESPIIKNEQMPPLPNGLDDDEEQMLNNQRGQLLSDLDDGPPLPPGAMLPPIPDDDEEDDGVLTINIPVEEDEAKEAQDEVKKPMFKRKMAIGDILVSHGVINAAQLEYALKYQEENARDKKLGEILANLQLIPDNKYGILISALMAQLQTSGVQLDEVGQFVDMELSTRFKLGQLEKEQFFPLRILEDRGIRTLDIFIENDADLFKLDDLAAIFNVAKVRPVGHFNKSLLKGLISEMKRVQAAEIRPESGEGNSEKSITVLSMPDDDDVDSEAIKRGRDDNYISRITNKIIFEGVSLGASDIHVEFGEVPRVRYRVDGMLQEGGWISPDDYPSVMSRLKIMAELDITEKRVPQDGNIRLGIEGFGVLDFRVNTIPSSGNEKVCLRILDSSKLYSLTLDQLGFPDKILEGYLESIATPQGLMLITGPTGSGKSTTLYSSMIYVLETRGKETNICTAEDPIEYRLEGLNQTQLNEKVGLTFPVILKALLRQDPDIILVGEIRDLETAGLAIKASQTGHFVFSTLHTNTAVATIARMVNMGVPSYLLADSLLAIINQRLARRICSHCAEPYKPGKKELSIIPTSKQSEYQLMNGIGCSHCGFKGYKGRIGFYEYLKMSKDLKRMIIGKKSEEEILYQARDEGFITLRDFGLMKVKENKTTLEEVLRHTTDQFE